MYNAVLSYFFSAYRMNEPISFSVSSYSSAAELPLNVVFGIKGLKSVISITTKYSLPFVMFPLNVSP